jgi:hypothetical protein
MAQANIETKQARLKAVKAIRVIINAAQELTAAEQALLKDSTSGTKAKVKGKPDAS